MSSFWNGKRVAVTGHTGFKGSWMSLCLVRAGAKVFGCSLAPETDPAIFDQLKLAGSMDHRVGDLRDPRIATDFIEEAQPDIVFHMAAQALVLRSYTDSIGTWNTNVMGTAHMLEALRRSKRPCLVVVITTDKVYRNNEWPHAYREEDVLGGLDPYSASKAGTELVVHSYRSLFEQEGLDVRLASARAGNVIGGGDWSENRLVPDIARALGAGAPVEIRNPAAIRPWQHVLEPIDGYMSLVKAMADDPSLAEAFNFGPEANDIRTVEDVMKTAFEHWPGDVRYADTTGAPHEANILKLTIEKAKARIGWHPKWDFSRAIAETMRWYRAVHEGTDPLAITHEQIDGYFTP